MTTHLNTGFDSSPPPLHSANLNIRLYDQNGNPKPTGSQDATTMRVEATYTDRAAFASNIFPTGILETATAYADGGLPQLDLFLCFDVSGSMDDQTQVTLVRETVERDGSYLRFCSQQQDLHAVWSTERRDRFQCHATAESFICILRLPFQCHSMDFFRVDKSVIKFAGRLTRQPFYLSCRQPACAASAYGYSVSARFSCARARFAARQFRS